MIESTTVMVGLDVHASSIRLAVVRGDELFEERTLGYDLEAVERFLRRWPAVCCCYEAGPTGFELYRYLVGRGIVCEVVAPGLVPERPGDRVKTDSRDARKDARLERTAARHRLSKMRLRHGRRVLGKSWG
jgi:transposase